MIPSDHFVRFYNEVFKFLAENKGLEPYYKEISRHQELHCLEWFRRDGLKGMYDYWEHIRIEENCEMEQTLLPDRLLFKMSRCPSLSKVLDCDAEPFNGYCDHCAGWVLPLMTKCGYYYVENIIGRKKTECASVITPFKAVAEEVEKEYLASAAEENTVFSNLADWENVEKNKAGKN
jgi:hypothetical protein